MQRKKGGQDYKRFTAKGKCSAGNSLSLADNALTDSDITPLMRMQFLQTIDLSSNKITNQGANTLFSRFAPESINLLNNEIVIEKKSLVPLFNTTKRSSVRESVESNSQKSENSEVSEIDIFNEALKQASDTVKFHIISKAKELKEFRDIMEETQRKRSCVMHHSIVGSKIRPIV